MDCHRSRRHREATAAPDAATPAGPQMAIPQIAEPQIAEPQKAKSQRAEPQKAKPQDDGSQTQAHAKKAHARNKSLGLLLKAASLGRRVLGPIACGLSSIWRARVLGYLQQDDVDREQVLSIVRATPFAMMGHIINTAIAVIALSQTASPSLFLAWSFYSYGLAFYVLFRSLSQRKRRTTRGRVSSRTVRKITILGVLLASPWAILAFLFLGHAGDMTELIVLTLAVGMAASGSVLLSPVRIAATAYMATILVPTTLLCLFVLDGPGYRPLGLLGLSYGVFLLALIGLSSRVFCERIKTARTLEKSLEETNRAREEISNIAFRDTLTGLWNRRALIEQLTAAPVGRRDGRGDGFALFFLGLDRFKAINETLGHRVGDELLRVAARRIRRAARAGDYVARLGGDEFAIIAKDIPHEDQAQLLAQRLLTCIANPFKIDGHTISITASIGAVLSRDRGGSRGQLHKLADLAMHEAKAAGPNTFCLFEPSMSERAEARRDAELGLRRALMENELELHYQPIFELSPERLAGFEALVRWRHPEKGIVTPDAFLPMAEELDLMSRIDRWVLLEACRQATSWPEHTYVSVNLSPREIYSDDITSYVAEVLSRTGLPAHRLELEITESALLEGHSSVKERLGAIRRLGVSVAMDDFGTGYSSLCYLSQFPFDTIKIDRAFVRDVLRNEHCSAIIGAVMHLARGLNLTTVAEGIETPEQLERIRALGVMRGQGYHFGRPAHPRKIKALLADERQGWRNAPNQGKGKRHDRAGCPRPSAAVIALRAKT